MIPNSTDQPVPPGARRNHGNRRLRRFLPYLGAAVLVGLIIAGFWPQPAPVETARAVVGKLRATVNEEGKTRIKHRFIVAAPVTGQLRRIPLQSGAPVQAGRTVLAVVDPVSPTLLDPRARSLAEARRDTAAANLQKARDGQTFATNELQRFKKLYADKVISIQELEAAQWRESAADRDVAAAEGNWRQAKAELAQFVSSDEGGADSVKTPLELKSPASGRVLRVIEENARVVTAGTPLLEIGDPADLEVVIEVLSRDGAAIAAGTPVELEEWGGGQPLAAKVRLVEPSAFTKVSALGVEEQRVKVIADLLTLPERRPSLGDQFRVEAQIILWETNRTLKLPAGALFRHGQEWATFVVSGGRARLRPVQTGRSSGVETQVIAGVQEGEEVILYPGDRVREGTSVKRIQIRERKE